MAKPPRKPPVIRAGDTKPFIKTTNEEMTERVELVENLLGQGARKGQIKKSVIEKYNVTARTVENYIARARDNIRKRFAQNLDQHRKDSFAFYEAMAGPNSKASAGARIRARERVDELLGLDAPRKTEVSGPDGKPLQVQTTTESTFDISALSKEEILGIDAALVKATRHGRSVAGN